MQIMKETAFENEGMAMRITGGTFSAEFSPELNNFSSIRNLVTDDEYLKFKPQVPLISIYVLIGDEKAELLPDQPNILFSSEGMTIHYTSFGGRPIEAVIRFKADGDLLHISATIENRDAFSEIVEILMPHISGIYLGESHKDDIIIYPHHAGERTVNPVSGYGKNKKDFWRASSVAYKDHFRREINYCGLASMSWMYYYDAQNGLYIGSHDSRFPVTGVIAETSGNDQKPWMGFGFRKYHRIRFGERYDTGEYVLGITDKDWHYGAKIYRSYIEPYLEFDNNPAFLKDEYALNQCYNLKRAGKIENCFKDIPRLYDEGRSWGVRHMFIASWNRTGFDSFYPEYYPDMELGSAMEFRRGLEYVRENGGFTTLYINARIFDTASDFHKTVGEAMAIRNEKGEMIHETYGPAHFTVNCPSDRLWRDYLLDTAEFALMAYDCDGIYLDQLASAEPYPCYNKAHSHENIGEFNNGYVYILRELKSRLKKHRPDAYIMTENCGDIYGSFTWGNLTWNGADYDEYYNVFKYTFPEYVQVNMVNPRGWEKDEQAQKYWFYKDMQRAVLLGSVLWMGITTRLTPDKGEYHTYARQALNFRRQIHHFIRDARFFDDAFIREIHPECAATCWELDNGSYFVLAGNHSLADNASLTIELPYQIKNATAYDIGWNKIDTEHRGKRLNIRLTTRLAFILMEP